MLRRAWDRWKIIAHKIGVFQSRLLLNIFYFLIVLPFGLGVRIFTDTLQIKRRSGSHWISKVAGANNWEQAKRQF
jgi:hypothetical protein